LAVVGGDSSPHSTKGAAGEDDESDPAAALLEKERLAHVDPGDRDEPLTREKGDPFEKGITNEQRARRIEGRKFATSQLFAGELFECLYKVERFRRFLPNRGSDGRGLVQFWGPRAVRRCRPPEDWPEWDVEGRKMQTVNVGDIRFRGS
jgi:hypothetical protein